MQVEPRRVLARRLDRRRRRVDARDAVAQRAERRRRHAAAAADLEEIARPRRRQLFLLPYTRSKYGIRAALSSCSVASSRDVSSAYRWTVFAFRRTARCRSSSRLRAALDPARAPERRHEFGEVSERGRGAAREEAAGSGEHRRLHGSDGDRIHRDFAVPVRLDATFGRLAFSRRNSHEGRRVGARALAEQRTGVRRATSAAAARDCIARVLRRRALPRPRCCAAPRIRCSPRCSTCCSAPRRRVRCAAASCSSRSRASASCS